MLPSSSRSWLVALVTWLLVGLPAWGSPDLPPPGLSISSWTAEQGLPQNSISDLHLDHDGYLWVATFGGLARFDGSRFDVITSGNRDDLPANRFSYIAGDGAGPLWFYSSEAGLLRYEDDTFVEVPCPGDLKDVVLGPGGRPWVLTQEGVERIEPGGPVLVQQGKFGALHVDARGVLWLATREGEVLRHEGGEQRTLDVGSLGGPAFALYEEPGGRLWMTTERETFRASDATNEHFELQAWAPPGVHDLLLDERGDLWLATSRGLFVASDPDQAEPDVVLVDPAAHEVLALGGRGNLWAGGRRSGGLKLVRHSPLQDLSATHPIPADDTWAIAPGRDGAVLLVQTRELLELRGDELTATPLESNCRAALVDRHGDLWIGETRGVLRVRDGQTQRFDEEPALRGGVRALYEDAAGTLWVGTPGGLASFDGTRFRAIADERLRDVRCLVEDPAAGCLWVGTRAGLARVAGDEVSWLTRADGLAPGSVRALHLTDDGVLWVGTYGGGLCSVGPDGVTRFRVEDGMADGFLSCLLEDDLGRLWINSNRGPFVVSIDELERFRAGQTERISCARFTPSEAAREANGGNQSAGWRAPDGTLWFATIAGVTLVDPAWLPEDEAPPRAVIERLVVGDERQLEARFTALDYASPERTRVQYRLVGDSDQWVETDGSREARYSYLRPGDYELQVRARNGYGAWSPVASQAFTIEARLSESPVLYALVALLVGIGIFGWAELRIRAAHERAERLQRLHDERDRAERDLARSQASLSRLAQELLTTQASERRTLSAELHDDITQRLAALAMQVELAQAAAADATSDERLGAIARSAQDLAGDVQRLSRRLHPLGLRVLGLSEAIREEAEALTRRSGIAVEIDEELALDEVSEEFALAAFRILQESLHNIEKHADASRVWVGVRAGEQTWTLAVRDDGVGFELEAGDEAGLGLLTMRERAASIGATLKIETAPGRGTTLRLEAPRHREHP